MSKLGCDCHEKCTHNNNCYDTHTINVSRASMAIKGIKGARVLTPILFTSYLDVLMDMLKSSGFGCYVGNVLHWTGY